MRHASLLFIAASLLAAPLSMAETPKVETTIGMPLRLIPEGTFIQGRDGGRHGVDWSKIGLVTDAQFYANDELPPHWTWIIEPFAMGEKEVTVGQFRRFVEETGYQTTAEKSKEGIRGWDPVHLEDKDYRSPTEHDFQQKPEWTWKNPGFEQKDDHPVVGVSWEDAQAFCKWLSDKEGIEYRMPTEAEWEYAARAGSQGMEWFGFGWEVPGEIQKYANIGNVELWEIRPQSVERRWLFDPETQLGDGHVFTAPVGDYQANAYGLHDLHGNVYEWCTDYYLEPAYKNAFERTDYRSHFAIAPVNVEEKNNEYNEFRVVRGGSWFDGPLGARTSARGFYDQPEAAAYLGFRVVRNLREGESVEPPYSYNQWQSDLELAKSLGAELKSLPNSTTSFKLEFDDKQPSADELKHLARMPGVTSLDRLKLETLTSQHIEALLACKKLTSLDFEADQIAPDTDLSQLKALPRLQNLTIGRGTPLQDRHIRQISSIEGLESFRFYDHAGTLTGEGLAALGDLKNLQRLHLYETQVDPDYVAAYTQLPLQELAIDRQPESVTDSSSFQKAAEAIGQMTKLRTLDVEHQPIGDDTIGFLANLLRLQSLSMTGHKKLNDAALGKALQPLNELTELNLAEMKVGPRTAASLRDLARISRLQLIDVNLTNKELGLIGHNRCTSNLTIRPSETASVDAQAIPLLTEMTMLEELDLDSPRFLGPELASLEALPHLRELTLQIESEANAPVEALAELKKLQRLRLGCSPELLEKLEPRLRENLPETKIQR